MDRYSDTETLKRESFVRHTLVCVGVTFGASLLALAFGQVILAIVGK